MEKHKTLYTEKEGQYLALILYYTKINGLAPAQADFLRYFNVSAPTVHQTILQLERKKLISTVPNTPRSLIVSLPKHLIPDLK
jgi:Mn-dependent DtxR family transcriptional regulator